MFIQAQRKDRILTLKETSDIFCGNWLSDDHMDYFKYVLEN